MCKLTQMEDNMITITFYRAGKHWQNKQMNGSFTKTFKDVDEMTKFIYSNKDSDVFLDPASVPKHILRVYAQKFYALERRRHAKKKLAPR